MYDETPSGRWVLPADDLNPRDTVISELVPPSLVERLRSGDERFAVTGAFGWFGTLTLNLLDAVLGDAMAARVCALGRRAGTIRLRSGRQLDVDSVGALGRLGARDDARRLYLLHFAFAVPRATDDAAGGAASGANQALRELIGRELVRLQPEGLLYPSSGAVYRTRDTGVHAEYGAEKRRDEEIFRRSCVEAGSSVVIPRVFAVGGPCSPHPERYLLGHLVACGRAGVPLTLGSGRRVYRSYSGLADVLVVALTELLSAPRKDTVFDTAGDEVVEAEELADLVRRVLDRPDLPIVRTSADMASSESREADFYVGDGTVFRSLASASGYELASLPEIIRQSALE